MPDAASVAEVSPFVSGDAHLMAEGPWRLAWRRLRRNRVAMLSLAVFLLIVAVSLAAPLYVHFVSHADPFSSNLSGTTIVHGKKVAVLQQSGGLGLGETPIGPTWDVHHYFLGADSDGRDVAARTLYGGRTSLEIGFAAAIACFVAAVLLALVAGFFGGIVDDVLSRIMDLVWAFPVYLVAIAISTVLLTQNLSVGPLSLNSGSLVLPIAIITLIFIPYVFRPIRGQVLAVRQREFVKAAIAQGASNWWLIRSEILPNVLPSVVVLMPLVIAIDILVESGLSFLGIGVQPPQASWGSIIGNGTGLLYTRPWVAIAPGIMILLVVLSLNVLGDGLRDALDPRAKLRIEG